MVRAIKMNGYTYEHLYRFDGGDYYVSSEANWGTSWLALMDDGRLMVLLPNGKLADISDDEYEIVREAE